MRRFFLVRHEDVSKISGTGIVAEGVQFSNGQCVMHWLTSVSSLVVHSSMNNLLAIHGHDGKSTIAWVDNKMKGEL